MKRVCGWSGWALLLTGMASLMIEMVWARRFAIVYGGTVPAGAAVLAAYLAGLAIGAAWLGRRADRARYPHRLLVLLPCGVGCMALASLALPVVLPRLYVFSAHELGWPVGFVRLLLAMLTLLPPAILMGGILPAAVCRHDAGGVAGTARSAGWLRFFNCAGAAVGALWAALILIPGHGLDFTTLIAAGLSFVAAAWVWLFRPSTRQGTDSSFSARASCAKQASSGSCPHSIPGEIVSHMRRWDRSWTVTLAFAVGMLTMMTQVAQFRAVSFLTSGTLASFAIVSAVYIAGLGLGAACGNGLLRIGGEKGVSVLRAIALACAGAGVAWSLPWLTRMRGELAGADHGVLAAAWPLLPAALALGLLFPMLVAGFGAADDRRGQAVGTVSAALEAGSVTGPVLVALWILPVLGTYRTLAGASGAALALALLDLLLGWRSRRALAIGTAVTVLAGGLAVYGLIVASRTSLYRISVLEQVERDAGRNARILVLREGLEGVVSVAGAWQAQEGRELRLLYLGRKMQSEDSTPWRRIEASMGALPAVLTDAEGGRAFHIGLGSGRTAAAAAAVAPARQVRVAELAPGVIEFLPFFHEALPLPFETLVGEGRSLLAAERTGLDVIVTDIVFPESAGAGALFSEEYFHLARSRLSDEGLFMHWLPLWQMAPDAFRSTVRAFLNVFPEATLWAVSLNPGRPLAGLVGWRGDTNIVFDQERMAQRLEQADDARALLAKLDFDRPESVWARFVTDAEGLARLAADREPSTDNRPFAEFFGAGEAYRNPGSENTGLMLSVWKDELPTSRREPDVMGPPAPDVFERARRLRAARRALAEIHLELAEVVLNDWIPGRVLPLAERLRQAHAQAPRDPEIAYELWDLLGDISVSAFESRQMDLARTTLEEALKIGPRRDFMLRRLALAKAIGGKPGDGLDEAREACRLAPDNPANWRTLQQVALSAGEHAEAEQAAARAGALPNAGRAADQRNSP